MLDHPRLEAGGLDRTLVALLVVGAHAHVDRAVDVELDARDGEAALLQLLALVALPIDLRVDERDHRRVLPDPVHQHALGDAELRCREPHPEGVGHDPGHPRDLVAQRLVEAVDGRRAALQHRVAVAADERHRRHSPGLELRIEARLLVRLGVERTTQIGLELVPLGCFVGHVAESTEGRRPRRS